MPIPPYDEFIDPLLRLLASRPEGVRSAHAYEAMADHFELTVEERGELLPSRAQAIYQNRIGWAHDRLKREGLPKIGAPSTRSEWALMSYTCETCHGSFGRFEVPGQCPLCKAWASVRCHACFHTAPARDFIANGDRCPKCGQRTGVETASRSRYRAFGLAIVGLAILVVALLLAGSLIAYQRRAREAVQSLRARQRQEEDAGPGGK